ncbi:MAG: SDR family oxidoreductase [Cyclobacteriaceae bacterium]
MDLHLKDKVVIVTGGAKGIGRAIVEELVKEGAIPVIVGRSKEASEELVREINKQGGKCLSILMELGVEDNCQSIVSQTIDAYGRIDGIVNNAGVNDGASLSKGPAAFKQSVLTNLTHYYDLVHYSLEYLKVSKGSVLNISSKTALTGQGGTSGYAASKGAQLALTREWAVELAPFDIRVNAIVPSEVMTPLYEKWLNTFDDPAEKLEGIVSKIPLQQRMTTAEEIAAMSIFLLSDRSAHTTGQWLFVDGGYVHLDRAIT